MQPVDIFPWNDHFDTGLAEIDQQHRNLVRILNRLASYATFGFDGRRLSVVVDELLDYANYHFQAEEAIWNKYLAGEEIAAQHKISHEHFVQTIQRLKDSQAVKTEEYVIEEALSFLAKWLVSHILESDRYLACVVKEMKSGLPADAAKQSAKDQLSGAASDFIDIILSIYSSLSRNTVNLMRELGERKRAEELFKEIFHTSSDAINITRATDGRYVETNQAFHKLTGYDREEVIGRTGEELNLWFDPADRQRLVEVLQREGKFQNQEIGFLKKNRELFWGQISASKLQLDGQNYFLSVTHDITKLKDASRELELTAQHLRTIIETEPECIKIVDSRGNLLEMNAAGLAMIEADSLMDAQQRSLISYIDREYQAAFMALHRRVMNGESGILEFKIKGLKGTTRWLETHATPMRGTDGTITSLLGITRDITERKRAEQTEKNLTRAYRLLSRSGSALAHAEQELELLAKICQLAVNTGGYLMAWVGFAENDPDKTVRPIALSGHEEGYLDRLNITWSDTESGRGPVGSAIRNGVTVVIQDVHTNPAMAPWRESAIRRGYQSCISLPLSVSKQVLGALTIYSTEPFAFIPEEVELLEELASELSFGIQSLRTRAEHEDSLLALRRESEKNFALLRNASDGIHILDDEGSIIEASQSFCDMLGYRRDEIIGMNVSMWDAGFADAEDLLAAVSKQIENPIRSQFETRHRRKDGTIIEVEVSGFPLKLDGKTVLFNSSRDITGRKRQELELLENERRLVEILNASPIAVRIATRQGREVVFHNPRYADLIQNIHAKGDDPRNYYARVEDYDEVLADLAQGRSVINRQIELKIHGKTVWVLATFMPINYQGEEAVLGWLYDITDQINAEMENRIAATAFESQEGMLITDANSNILRVNRAFTRITGYSAQEVIGNTPRILSSGRQDEKFYADMWEIINNSGAWEGEIWNKRKDGVVYPEHISITAVKDISGKVVNYVASLTDITQRKKSEEQIQYLAFYDQLTELPNRRLLMDRLQQVMASSIRSGRQGALLFIDLDNFKTLNDTLGHEIGDMLLKQVAVRLATCVREGDTVARLGGDEFVVVLEDFSEQAVAAAEQAEIVGEKILVTLRQPYQLLSHEYSCTSSIGLTLFEGGEYEIEELLKQADIAMYQAKNAGRNTMRFFDPDMQKFISDRASLESELRKALEKMQFQLHYQIQVDNLGQPIGAEALIRWIHPERGLVSPAEFIPIAEETGLIVPIGDWLMDTACAQLKAWEQDASSRNLVLAVNVSASQFRQVDFVAQVLATIRKHEINPLRLKLELTESMLVEDIENIIKTMSTLKVAGIQFSMDDFGTGYSSLQYLKRLPLDQLKIDMSFVRDLGIIEGANSIVQTIIAMAHSLKLDVIAEGVETEEQREILAYYGCQHYQGYLFSKPVQIEQFEELLKQN
ncbi:MAG: bacteriohemerythrin [Gallionella sp.]